MPLTFRSYCRWLQSPALLLCLATIAASWLGMQWVHEFGHVPGASLSGGRVEQVVLHPLAISRTDLAANPHPLFVVWAGPLLGVLLPLIGWLVARRWFANVAYLLRFFAGFCLLANGLYIGLGSFDEIGDCGDMLRSGSSLWQLWAFGCVTCPAGFYLWNGLGGPFGLTGTEQPRWSHGIAIACIAVGLATCGVIFFGEAAVRL